MDATNNRRGRFGLLLLLLLLAGTIVLTSAGTVSAAPAVVYVRAAATGANSGASWTDAYTSLQSALGAATSGQQVWVAAGTYSPGASQDATFTLKNGVAVYGGFPAAGGEWASRDPGANVTTFDGGGNGTDAYAGTYHLVTAPAGTDGTAILDGFTVRGANTYVTTNTKGGGLLVYGSPTLSNLIIKNNYSCYCGGGMYIEGGSPTLTHIDFRDNTAMWYGGGLAIRNGSPTMRDINFRDNKVRSGIYGGGGMHVVGGHPTLTDALFSGNNAVTGGGVGLTSLVPGGDGQGGSGTSYPDTSLALANVVFANNRSTSGGAGMNAAGGSATLTNVDFIVNYGDVGAGLRLGSSDSLGPNNAAVSVTNSILWGNTVSGSPQQIIVTGGSLTVTSSDVQGGWSGAGNISSFPFINSGDPSLLEDVDWDGLDNVFGTIDDGFRLAVGSPAVDAGSNAAVPSDLTADLFDDPRIQDGDGDGTATVDMGALEAQLPVSDDVIYVNQAATGANDGTSWADAFTDLQAGLALAGPGTSTQVWVAAGTYKPTIGSDRIATFVLKSGVTVYGGFPATGDPGFADRDPDTFVTTLTGDLKGDDGPNFANRGDNLAHVVSAFSWVDSTAVLDGFTIRGGNASGLPRVNIDCFGGGMYNVNGAPRLVDVRLSDNSAAGRGGGMFTKAGAPTLVDVTFAGNHGANAGGGLQLDSGSAALADVNFEGNTSTGVGGGMCVANPDDVLIVPDLTLSGATFTDNTAQWGGGYAASAGNASIHSATFTGNHADYMGGAAYIGDYNWLNVYLGEMDLVDAAFRGNSASFTPSPGYAGGGAMMIFDAAPTLTNVVFSGNQTETYGGGIYVMLYENASGPTLTNVTFNGNAAASGGAISADYGRATVRNSILWGDSGGEVTGAVTVSNSIVQGGYAGTGNSTANPLFVAPVGAAAAPTTAGDLRLQATSPAIDAGVTAAVPADVFTDLDGSARVMGPAVDMGAYEYHVPVTISAPTVEVVSTSGGGIATFHATVSPAAALTGLDFTLHVQCKIVKRRGGWHEIAPVAMSEDPSGVLSASCTLPKRGYWRAWVESSVPSGYFSQATSSVLTLIAM